MPSKAGCIFRKRPAATEALHLDRNELDAIEHIITQMEGEAGTDRLSALADMRFSFIGDVCGRCVVKPHESREHVRSVKIDRILTGRYTAIPAFLVIMGLVFWLTFGVIGAALQGLMENGIAAVIASADAGLKAFGTNDVVRSLAVDGVLTGVGSVLTFLPIIVVLFLFLSILEDSGYMARVAFVMDKVLRRLDLATGVRRRRSSPDLLPRRASSRPSRCFWAQRRPRCCQPCFRRLPLTCSWSLRCCTRPAWRPSAPSRASWARAMPWPCSRFK